MAAVRMYTTPWCGYCNAAKRFLKGTKSVPFEDIDVSGDSATRQWLLSTTGQRTVPQIWIGATHVGGFDDMMALERAGRLDALLTSEDGGAAPDRQ